MRRALGLLVCATLLSAAMATSAQAVTNERFDLEITYTGAGDLTQTQVSNCYDTAGKYQRDVVINRHSSVQWTTIYAPAFFIRAGSKDLLPSNQLGNAENPSHRLTGSYQSDGTPCLSPNSGTLGEVDGVNKPTPTAFMPIYGILNGTNIEFRLAPTANPGETDRSRMFANQYASFGYGMSNWDPRKSAPDLGGGAPVYSLTGIFTLSLRELRDLTEGRKASLEIDVQQPSLPGFEPQCGSCTVTATMAGHVKVIATCSERTKTGNGYAMLDPAMKRALASLYKELDRQRACYRFTIGHRTFATQKDLFDRWHAIADRRGPSERRTAEQVCTAVRNAHFAQCPSGGASFRSGRVANGGPATPGTSRHEKGAAADITVRFPPRNLNNLAKYQAAARKAGLCGPPRGDDVHVELPYAATKGGPVRCHFPPGPAP